MYTEHEMIRRIEELEEAIGFIGDSVILYRKEIMNLQNEVQDLKGKLAYTSGMLKELIKCVSSIENG
jgi:hypothetical protein